MSKATGGLLRISALAILAALSIEVGRRSLTDPSLAVVGAAALVVAALALIDPVVVAVLVVPGVFLIQRVGGGGIDLSGSDALLVVGTIVAFPLVSWDNPGLRRVLAMIFAFQACLLVTVLVHPTRASAFEWGHRLFLTAGSVVVGAALASAGRTRVVLGTFMIGAAGLGCLSAAASVASGFEPGYVLGFHKNFVGSMTVTGLVIGYLAPTSTGLSERSLTVAKTLCAVGLLGSQSRGAIVALLLGLIVASIRSPAVWRRSSALVVVLVPLTLFAYFSLRPQLDVAPGVTSSITERARYREQAMSVWRDSPIVGKGMRFFKNGDFVLESDPHNVIVASLSETGIVGLAALVALLGGATTVLWGLNSTLALAALTVLVSRFVNGLFDIYWVAGTQSLPWMIVGLALGQRAAEPDPGGVRRSSAGATRAASSTGIKLREESTATRAVSSSAGPEEPGNEALKGSHHPTVTRVYHSAVVGNWRSRDRLLRAGGADVLLISAARWDEGGKKVTCKAGEDDFVVAVRTIGSHPNLFLYDPRPIWRCLRLRSIDVLDVHEEPCSLAAAELRLLRRLLCPSAKLVLYSAQNIFKRYPWPIRMLERGALREASGAYVCNRRAGEILRKKGFRGKISVLPLGVDIESFAPDTPVDDRPSPGLRLGYVGRLDEHKGIQVVIEAICGYPSWSLEIVGEGPYRQALMQQVRSAKLTSQVTQRGFVPNHELPRLYRSFDVLVVPSLPTPAWEEQFCRVAVEAMASGVPVVASASGALPEVVGNGGLLFRPGDVSHLRDVLRRLEADHCLRRQVAEAGLVRARQFTWKAVASGHRQLYEDVLT